MGRFFCLGTFHPILYLCRYRLTRRSGKKETRFLGVDSPHYTAQQDFYSFARRSSYRILSATMGEYAL